MNMRKEKKDFFLFDMKLSEIVCDYERLERGKV